MTAEIFELKKGYRDLNLGQLPACEVSKKEINRVLIRIISDKKLTGEDIAGLLDELGDDMGLIPRFLQDKSIDDARKRSLWMLMGYYDEVKWMTVPMEFLPHFECQRRERERTKAYAFSQAYLLSKKIAKEYLDTNNLQEFYREIPNLLIACMQLHQLGVVPRDIGSGSTCATLLEEALSFAELLQDGIKDFYIQKTPEIGNLLDQIKVRRVV